MRESSKDSPGSSSGSSGASNGSGNDEPMLELRDIEVQYGQVRALKRISFSVKRGEILALIGANGAGKTTTLRAISGLLAPSRGNVVFEGQTLLGLRPDEIVRRGVGHAPEGRGIFTNMSVRENLDLGSYLRRDRADITSDVEKVFELFPRLKERIDQNAGTLSGGEQQMLAIGRALMSRPKLLLLDEPSLGLAPQVMDRIFETIVKVNQAGTTILLVEQNALMALEIAHEALALETGTIKLKGKAKELLNSEEIKKAYLGG